MKKPVALVVDDESNILRFVRVNLRASGFEVASATTGTEALEQFHAVNPNVIILDIMLPEIDGLEVCRRIRQVSDVPIVMITAKNDIQDAVEGLNAGADDYITKPFAVEELLARINAVLRRAKANITQTNTDKIKIGNLLIDMAQRQAVINDQPVHLTPTEFKLLTYLANNVDKVVPHEELLMAVWGSEYKECTHYLRVSIGRLRQKIEADPGNPEYIVTCSGVGYMIRNVK
ncbi:response regulator [Thermanaerosceptrum fracticalcis]|uniref:Stage 0 sporulation protein A homolog n=1 Tax=Thermanaerosceptrum fracticalcis TaxID=1712410 RepID=A0A7G6DZ29_THEFR|nr:response regulator transcription factor [Thermanaerosceptrum fracticalcis]QNB45083.1 response regulator [Thermanaerosceptrum fracticalcis]